jgi:DNA-binding transcriptional ArsR family regulator
MRDDPAAFGAWTIFFLEALAESMRPLAGRLNVAAPARGLLAVQQALVTLVEAEGRATTAFLAARLGLPERTARYHLDALVGRGLVVAHGKRRGRFFTAPR